MLKYFFMSKIFPFRYWPSGLKIEGYDSVCRIILQFNRGIKRSRAKILNTSHR